MKEKDKIIYDLIEKKEIDVDILTGEIYSFRAKNGRLGVVPRKITGYLNRDGYRAYLLYTSDGRKHFRGNRIVWIKTHKKISENMCVCHLNNVKTDNYISNLYIADSVQNSNDAARDGLYRSGENNPAAKLSYEKVKNIRDEYIKGKISYKKLGRKYHVSKTLIEKIINNNIWKK